MKTCETGDMVLINALLELWEEGRISEEEFAALEGGLEVPF